MSGIINNIKSYLSETAISTVFRIIGAGLVIIIGFWIIGRIVKLIGKTRALSGIEKSVATFISTLILVVLRALVIFTGAAVLGVPTASIITLIGSLGLALGLALQGSLSNLAGGMLIIIFKTFKIGDYIETASGESGTVIEIGVFYTKIRTISNSTVVLPNGVLSNQPVINHSALPTRRLELKFNVSYNTDIVLLRELIEETVSAHPLVLKEQEIFVKLLSIDENTLNILVRVWCKTADYWNVLYDLNERIKEMFDKNRITVPFRQVGVHIDAKNKIILS